MLNFSGFAAVNEVGRKYCEGCGDNEDNLVCVNGDECAEAIRKANKKAKDTLVAEETTLCRYNLRKTLYKEHKLDKTFAKMKKRIAEIPSKGTYIEIDIDINIAITERIKKTN